MNKEPLRHGPHHDSEFHHHHSHAATSAHPGEHHLLAIEDLSVGFEMYEPDAPYFSAGKIIAPVVHDLNLSVHKGEVLALVGASGSGKTVLADAIMGFGSQMKSCLELSGSMASALMRAVSKRFAATGSPWFRKASPTSTLSCPSADR